MARQADFGGTRFQGYAQSSNSTVKGKSKSKALEGRKNQIIQEADTKRRQQFREQQAATSFLKGQQTAAEANQKTGQLSDRQALDLSQNAQKASLKLESDFQDRSLRFEEMQLKADQLNRRVDLSNQKAKLTYDGVIAQADARVASANTKLFADTIGNLLQFSGSVVQYSSDKFKRDEKDKNEKTLVENTFPLEKADYGGAKDVIDAENEFSANEPSVIRATEKAITSSTKDKTEQSQLREELYTNSYGQVSRSNAVVAASDFPVFFSAFVGDTRRSFRRLNGEKFTVATAKPGDVQIILDRAKSDFYRLAGLDSMSISDRAQTVVPVVVEITRSWALQANKALNTEAAAELLLAAEHDTTNMLNAGTLSPQEIYNETSAAYFGSGGYGGQEGKANLDSAQELLDWAVRKKRPDFIKKLALAVDHKGRKLGEVYEEIFDKARTGVVSREIADIERESNLSQIRVQQIGRDRISALAQKDVTPEDEVRINAEAIEAYQALETPEGKLKAAQLKTTPNYSPFTFLELKKEQAEGRILPQSFLHNQADTNQITMEEAKQLGYDPEGGVNGESLDTASFKRAKEFKLEMEAQGSAALLTAIERKGKSGFLESEASKILMKGKGLGVKNDIARRLNQRVTRFIRDNPGISDSKISEYIQEEGKRIGDEVEFVMGVAGKTENTFDYTMGGTDIRQVLPTLTDEEGQNVADFRNYTAQQLGTRAEIIDLDTAYILSAQTVLRAQIALSEGKEVESDVVAKAAAVGTTVEVLVESQRKNYQLEKPEPVETSVQTNYTPQPGDTGKTFGDVSQDAFRRALIGKESSFNPTAENKRTKAFGLGQVLPKNIGPWSREILGYTVSQRELSRNPSLQEQIINGKLNQYFMSQMRLGYEGEVLIRRVAAMWYGGPGAVEHWNNPGYHANFKGEPNMQQYTKDLFGRYQN
jgi:hypothetical protein